MTYCHVVSHLLESYSSHHSCWRRKRYNLFSTTDYLNTFIFHRYVLHEKVMHFSGYDDYVVKGMFIKGPSTSIEHCWQAFCSRSKGVSLQRLAYKLISLRTVQAVTAKQDHATKQSSTMEKWKLRQPTMQEQSASPNDTCSS